MKSPAIRLTKSVCYLFYFLSEVVKSAITLDMATGNQLPVHKVIMVGTGGVGKSALTLRFMYNEVRGG